VKRFALCCRTVVCPVCPVCLTCPSVTLVYCGQTVGWIKMKLGMEVGIGPGHIVLDGDPPSRQKGAQPPPILGPCLLWPNGWMDQDATWYGGRPRPRPHSVRLDPAPSPQKVHSRPSLFGPCLLWPNGLMDQDATWYEGRPRPRPRCVRWGPISPKERGTSDPANFRPLSTVAKRLDGSRCHLVRR